MAGASVAQAAVTTSVYDPSHTVPFTWHTPGIKTIIVTATNVGGTVTDTHAITINVPPVGVDIDGPVSGSIDAPYTFTATVNPPTARTRVA